MKTTDGWFWMDGQLQPPEAATCSLMTHSLHYGLSIFEGMRAYEIGPGRGAVFRLAEHCRRLTDTARMIGLDARWTADELAAACIETLRANGLTEAYVRPILYLGPGPMDVVTSKNPLHGAIAVWPWGAYLGEEGLRRGIRCGVSSWQRISARDHLPKGKISGHYVNSMLAKDEALRLGFDEALMMDERGHVLEGSSENLFLVRDGRLVTPPTDSAILGGITRASVIELAKEMGWGVDERLFGRDALYLADEVFLTGTAAEVTPVREIDGRIIGAGHPGPVTRRLQRAYREAVRGALPGRADWLAPFDLDADLGARKAATCA